MKIETLSILEASKDTVASIWVLNNSGKNGTLKGVINLGIPESTGQVNTVVIPVTYIPVDLTTQATKSAILKNPNFRRLLQNKLLTLVTEECAEKMLDSKEARQEQARILEIKYEDPSDQVPTSELPLEAESLMNQKEGKIAPFALNLAHNSTGNEADLVASIRANTSSLTEEDFKYIVATSVLPLVKAEAAKMLLR